MVEFDGRRRRYVPLDVLVAHGRFGTKLIDKWGIEGIGTWMLFLAACKREPVQGTFTYTTDAEGWGKLGATASGFTLDEFWRVTGQCKKTSRRRHGRVSYIVCTVWETWNSGAGAALNPRSEPHITKDLAANTNGLAAITRTELEVDFDLEGEGEKGLKNGTAEPVAKATEPEPKSHYRDSLEPVSFTARYEMAKLRKEGAA